MNKLPLSPSARVSGGTPNGFPDYRPINKLSRAELADILRPPKPTLYQVWVLDRLRGYIPVGPKCENTLASEFCSAIQTQIRLGRERDWNSPHVVLAL